MGNYSSAIYADVEDFKAIVSSPEGMAAAQNMLEETGLINNTKPRVLPQGPVTLERLKVELQDMRDELEQLKTQHKREIKLLMNELDEEKKIRLSLQVEVEHLKKHMSK